MKRIPFFWLLLGSLLLINCGRDEIQLSEQQVKGLIAGVGWEYKSSNAFIFSSNLKYQIMLLSNKETAKDPCTVRISGNTHISMIVPLQRGSFSLPLPNVQESPRFHISAGNTPIATSGFLEIFDINNSIIFGYLQAQFDDENTVEGSFEAFVCN